jgi:hypothetical protein
MAENAQKRQSACCSRVDEKPQSRERTAIRRTDFLQLRLLNVDTSKHKFDNFLVLSRRIVTFASLLVLHGMKKGLALFLLLMMLATSVQPTLALHFCGGHFRSLAIGDVRKSCCEKNKQMKANALPDTKTADFFQPVNSCCSTYTINIATDTYQSPKQSTIEAKSLVIHPVLFPCDFLSKENTFSFTSLDQTVFPPGKFALHNVDLLTLICIFQI